MTRTRSLLAALLPLATLFAAAESLSVRLRLPWRELGALLFAEALALWLVAGLFAAVPAAWTLRFLERRRDPSEEPRRRQARAAGVLLGWMSGPVAAHAALDRYVGLGGNFVALDGFGPWEGVVGSFLASVLLGWIAYRLVLRFGGFAPAIVVVAASFLVGTLVRTDRVVPPAPAGALPSSSRPNLLLLVWDTTRSDRLTPYGYDRPTTPHLERLADESVLFERATSVSTFTFTSHLSMLTGVYPSTHGARLLSIRYDPRRARTLTEELRRAGYRTGAFVGTDVLAGRTGLRHGFECYSDRVDPMVCDTFAWSLVHDLQALAARAIPALGGNGSPHWFQDFQRPASGVLADALEWIQEDDPRPWFCFINLYDVHWPYLPEADGLALVSAYDGPLDGYLFRSNRWKSGTRITEADRLHVSELYDGELLELDEDVDAFLDALDLEDGSTAVLMTSDHGEAFGEAGRWKHEDILEPQVHVPMLLRPAEPTPTSRRVRERASGVDVAPTLLALAGLDPLEGTEGRSLLDPLAPDRAVFLEDRDHLDPADVRVALYEDHWKLVRLGLDPDAPFQLFDLSTDPLGVHDVASEHPRVLERMAERFLARRAERAEADRSVGAGDNRAAAGLEALGYAGK